MRRRANASPLTHSSCRRRVHPAVAPLRAPPLPLRACPFPPFRSSLAAAQLSSPSAQHSTGTTTQHPSATPLAASSTGLRRIEFRRNQRGKLRACSRCASMYCGLACLKQHSGSGLCEATRTLPPMDGIAEEDRLSVEQLAGLWPSLQRLCMQRQVANQRIERNLPAPGPPQVFDVSFGAAELAPLVELYPPRLAADAVWWTSHCRPAFVKVVDVLCSLDRLVEVLRCADSLAHDDSEPELPLPPGWGGMPTGLISPVFIDGRLIHRLIVYAIYFFRHVDPLLLPSGRRPHVYVQSDEHGELPLGITEQTRQLCSLGYLSSVDATGRRLLLPFVGPLSLSHPLPFCSVRFLTCHDHRKMLLTSGADFAPAHESGLLVMSERMPNCPINAVLTSVHAFGGRTADRFSCAVSDLCCIEANEVYRKVLAREGKYRGPQCALIEVMREALGGQWPKAYEALFIAIPRRGLESELAELLLLEALKEEAEAGDERAQQLLDHLVEESGAVDEAALIDAQRSRVEEMQRWQQEQLRLHAEAVARTEYRSSQHKAIKTAPLLVAPSKSAAASSHQIDECQQTPSFHTSACASASVLTAGNGSAPPAVSSALSLTQSTSSIELACSWTADAALTDVASLLQTGRRKFGVIVKAAVKFLHSLHPTSINQSGSHRVFHFGQTGPVTLVLPHAGRRSKDGTVSQRYCTRLYKAMQEATMSQFGPMHAAALLDEVQPQLQLKAAGCSSASVAELD